jgi:DNA phosphorothioation-dependent restriction protein DptH
MNQPSETEKFILGQFPGTDNVTISSLLLTPTMLGKSIIDATENTVEAFSSTGLHNYENQKAGIEHRKKIKSYLLDQRGLTQTTLSVYRPKTKRGVFRRLWIDGLKQTSPQPKAGDLIAILQDGTTCLVINASNVEQGILVLDRGVALFDKKSSEKEEQTAMANKDPVSQDLKEIPSAGSPVNIFAAAFAHLLWQGRTKTKVRVQFPFGVEQSFVESIIIEANKNAQGGGWRHENPFAILVNQRGESERDDVVAVTPDGSVAYRPSPNGPDRLLCEMYGETGTLSSLESITSTFVLLFDRFFPYPGTNDSVFVEDVLTRLAKSSLQVCMNEAGLPSGKIGEDHTARLGQIFAFLSKAHDAFPGIRNSPSSLWFTHVEQGLLTLTQALKDAPKESDLDEFMKTTIFACFSIPTPNNGNSYTEGNLTHRKMEASVKEHWSARNRLEETLAILAGSKENGNNPHTLQSIDWTKLNESIRQTGSPLLGVAHHEPDLKKRISAFKGLSETQFFAPHGERDFSVLRITDNGVSLDIIDHPSHRSDSYSLHMIDRVRLDWDQKKLISQKLQIELNRFSQEPLDDQKFPDLEVKFSSDSNIKFNHSVKSRGGKIFAEGYFERTIEETASGGFTHSLCKDRISLLVNADHPLSSLVSKNSATDFIFLPPSGEAILAVELKTNGKIGKVEISSLESFTDKGQPVLGGVLDQKLFNGPVTRTIAIWVSSSGLPVLPAIEGTQVSPHPKRENFWYGPELAILNSIEITTSSLHVELTVERPPESPPRSPLIAAVLGCEHDKSKELPHHTIRADLEEEYSRLVSEDLWRDSLGHIVLPSDREIPIGGLVSVGDGRFLTAKGLASEWNNWAARPSIPVEFADSLVVREFQYAFEALEIAKSLSPEAANEPTWPSKTSWKHLAEKPEKLHRYLETYANLMSAAKTAGGSCPIWASYPFSATVWETKTAARCLAVLISPLHPIRLAWLAQTEATLSGAESARDFCGSIEGWNLPLMGPTENGPAQMLAVATESGPDQLFLGWSALLKCDVQYMSPLTVNGKAGDRDLPGVSATGLNATAVEDALRDFGSIYPHISTISVDLASETPAPRIKEIDEKLIDVVVDLAKGNNLTLPGGLRVFDSINRTGPIPVSAVRNSTQTTSAMPIIWSRYKATDRPSCDIRFLEGGGIAVGRWQSEDGGQYGVIGQVPLRRFDIPNPQIKDNTFASLDISVRQEGSFFNKALCLLEGSNSAGNPLLKMRLQGQEQAAGKNSSWTVFGESLIPPVAIAELLNQSVGSDASQILWEWHPPFLGANNQNNEATLLERRPYMVMVRVPKRLTSNIKNLLERLTGEEQEEKNATDILRVLGTQGIGLASLTEKGRKNAVGAVGFYLTLKLMADISESDADYFVVPIDATHGFLSSLAGRAGNAADSRSDLIILRLTSESLTLVPVEIKLYGVDTPSPQNNLPAPAHRNLEGARSQLSASMDLLKDVQDQWNQLRSEGSSPDLTLMANALATFVETGMRLSPKACNSRQEAAERLERIANGSMDLKIGRPLLAFFTRTTTNGDLRCDKFTVENSPSDLGASGEYVANGAGVLHALKQHPKPSGKFLDRWREILKYCCAEETDSLNSPPKPPSTEAPTEPSEIILADQDKEEQPLKPELEGNQSDDNDLTSTKEPKDADTAESPINAGGSSAPNKISGEGVKFPVGTLQGAIGDNAEAYFWPSNTALNQLNIGIVGDLGTGKTQLLQMLLTQLRRQTKEKQPDPMSALILDYKGDFLGEEFLTAVDGQVLQPEDIPLTVIGLQDGDTRQKRSRKKGALIDVLHKIYGGIGPVQTRRLKKALDKVWDSHGASPTLDQLLAQYLSDVEDVADSVVSILENFVDACVFSENPDELLSFAELMDRKVIVLNLHSLGQDQQLKNALVALFLNNYYEYMGSLPQGQYQGENPQLRHLNSLLVVDEATNIMAYKFDALGLILRQGREFGVGVALSTQYLNDFKVGGGAGGVDYAEPLLTWFIHKVPSVTRAQLNQRGLPAASDEDAAKITKLEPHFVYYKSLNHNGRFMRGIPFFELSQNSPENADDS